MSPRLLCGLLSGVLCMGFGVPLRPAAGQTSDIPSEPPPRVTSDTGNASSPSTSETSDDSEDGKVLAGHSHHGAAFNEGPRQKAYIMGGTGEVTFPVTTTSPQAQRFVNQGIGQLHGFWYFEAERSFRQAAAIDPDCAMAYWGMAFANKSNRKRAKGFIEEAVERKDNATDREQMYIEALQTFVNAKGSYRGKRGRELAHAFKAIADKYPHDIEARAFQGLLLYFSRQHKPALEHKTVDKVLRKVLEVNPRHPCHHYVIHLWDYKDPAFALPSAAVCGQSAPAIAHMWHMPGHIYSRLKRYRDAVWHQEASARVDHAHMIRDRVMPDQIHNFAHNNEWLTRNLIHVGRLHDAIDLAKNMIELPRHPKYNTLKRRGSTYYGRLHLFRVLYEFEMWDELIRLTHSPYLEPTDRASEQVKRLRYLGRAYYAKGDTEKGDAVFDRLNKRLQKQKAERQAAVTAAKAKYGKQPGRLKTERKKLDRSFDGRIKSLQKAVDELKGRKAVAAGDFKTGLAWLRATDDLTKMDSARVEWQSGNADAAVLTLRDDLKRQKNEVLPLAHYVYALWKAGQKDVAKEEFAKLRTLAGEADLDAPALKRLQPLAGEFGLPADWRTPAPRREDFGPRPPLKELGPFRWHPYKADDWALKDVNGKVHRLKDYRGKPVIVIFYLGYGCLHCAQQLEAFAPKTEEFRKAGFELIAISTDNQQDLKQSHENYRKGKFPFPLVSNADLDVFKTYRCYDDFEKLALHGTFVIDADGDVRWQDISYEPFMDPDFVLNEAQRLLDQSSVSSADKENRKSKDSSSGTAETSASSGE